MELGYRNIGTAVSFRTGRKGPHAKKQQMGGDRTIEKKSAVTNHAIILNHVIDWVEAKVIDRENLLNGPVDQRSNIH